MAPIPDGNIERSRDFDQLRRSLRGLAVAGSEQPPLFPDSVATADQLARDFDQCAVAVRRNYQSDLSEDEAEALASIERKFATMSRDGAEFDAELWTESALRTSEHWTDVRTLARSALEAFGWRTELPSGIG